jgi:hypothetical protein
MSRAAARAVCRLVAAVIVVAVATLAAVVLVEVIAAALGASSIFVGRDRVLDRARSTTWSDETVRNTSLLLGAAGVVLLGLALWPRHADTLATAERPGVGVRRRDVAKAMRRAAAVDGVHHADVRIKGDAGRTVAVSARSHRTLAEGVDDRVREAVRSEARRLSLPADVRVDVRYDRASSGTSASGTVHAGTTSAGSSAGEDR